MKKLQILMMAVAGCFAISSCDSDDDNNNDNGNSAYVGTYNMTSWNAPMAMDFDGNGTTSTNFMNETNCYNNSKMTLNNDGTYNMTYNSMGITGTTAGCNSSQVTSGTWTRSGNSISTTASGSSTANTYSFANGSGSNGATLTRYLSNSQYPTMSGNTATWGTGNVNMVFTRSSN